MRLNSGVDLYSSNESKICGLILVLLNWHSDVKLDWRVNEFKNWQIVIIYTKYITGFLRNSNILENKTMGKRVFGHGCWVPIFCMGWAYLMASSRRSFFYKNCLWIVFCVAGAWLSWVIVSLLIPAAEGRGLKTQAVVRTWWSLLHAQGPAAWGQAGVHRHFPASISVLLQPGANSKWLWNAWNGSSQDY